MIPYDREVLVEVLVYHWRSDITGCGCGWAELGRSHPEHVANVYELAATLAAPFRDQQPEGDTDMTDINEETLTPRQIELRDGLDPKHDGLAARRAERLLGLERELSKKQAKTYELLRLRDHVRDVKDVGEDVVAWNVDIIERAVARSEETCAELQTEITALRGAR